MDQPPLEQGILYILVSLFPLFLISLFLVVTILFIAKRKGKSAWMALIAFIPLANMLYAIWLCSLTDKSVLQDIQELKQKASSE